jgi:hypothetical protein
LALKQFSKQLLQSINTNFTNQDKLGSYHEIIAALDALFGI